MVVRERRDVTNTARVKGVVRDRGDVTDCKRKSSRYGET